jgi:hypothetical protein
MSCENCHGVFARKGNQLTLIDLGKSRRTDLPEECAGDSDSFWLPQSGRSNKIVHCETCRAHWDEYPDGSMHLFRWDDDPFGVARKYQSLTKSEWALVGMRLKPDAGNATCSKCDADYLVEGDVVIPLHTDHDPYGFMAEYRECRLELDAIRFLGVFKASGNAGPVCAECRTEFDEEGDYLRLRGTNNETLLPYLEQARPLEDWHRLARRLPAIDEEPEWRAKYDEALRTALLTGEIPWADRKDSTILWRSDAELQEPRARGRITLRKGRLEFASRRHKWTGPVDAIRQVKKDANTVGLLVVGEPEPMTFEIAPETVAVELGSGRREVVLDSEDFAAAVGLAISDL